jgi:hypothetical protein
VITLAAILLPAVAAPPDARLISLSLPALQLAAGERIVGFHLQVTSGRIAQLPEVPIGWNISVENDPSWNTKIDASIIVAAAAVDGSFFNNFLVLEREERPETPFDVKGEISVSSDFSMVRRIQLRIKDFTMKQAAPLYQSQRAKEHNP